MSSNSHNFPKNDAENSLVDGTLFKNISIAALVGIIAFIGISSLVIAASQNSVIQVEEQK
ncbi:MAG: hypothetical protein AB4080_25430 [Trichodesmium sp.]